MMNLSAKTYHAGGTAALKWWHKTVFYQIYPRSFQDSDGDGVGDLAGVTSRLDYLAELGIDAIWFSPIYPSPMADFGYDVSDYCDIHPLFGDLEIFDQLLTAAHERNIKIILDFVPNHSSDQHPWFLESRSSRDNPKRDWYIWKDGRTAGEPPNNWQSVFGGSAWEWDEQTGQYYLHTFLSEQPEFNWRNPEVIEAMYDVMRFWLDLGVDGFRVDAILSLIKHADFPDNPPVTPGSQFDKWGFLLEPRYTMHQPEMFDYVRDMSRLLGEYKDRVHIGETVTPDLAGLIPYYGKPIDGYDIPHNFKTVHIDWNAAEMRAFLEAYYDIVPAGGWPNFFFGNHDLHRFASRYGVENHRAVAMLLLTLWGVATLYYGDELGMEDVDIPLELRVDPAGLTNPDKEASRDPNRTPMQWDDSPNAGFTTGRPWLPLANNYERVNVAMQSADEQSTLSFYKQLLQLRRELTALHNGSLTFVDGAPEEVVAYVREAGEQRLLVAINFGSQEQKVDISNISSAAVSLLSTHFTQHKSSVITLQPHESVLLQID